MVMSLFLAVSACGGDSGTNGGDGDGGDGSSATTSVTVADFSFTPSNNTVVAGATVTWTWTGNARHNVTFASSSITSSTTQTSGTFQAAMPSVAGAYTYQCTIHPGSMNGTVTVQ